MKNAILHFFGKQNDGTIPWDFYIKDFKREDFGLALRIEEDLAKQNQGLTIVIIIATAILAIIIISCTIAILRNQKKTRKMLKQMMEEQKKDNGEVN